MFLLCFSYKHICGISAILFHHVAVAITIVIEAKDLYVMYALNCKI